MVRSAPKPSLREASCCKVLVANGGAGWRCTCFFSTLSTRNCRASIAATARLASASFARPNLSSLLPSSSAQARLEVGAAWRGERRLDAPVFLRLERLDLVLALADQAQRHRLHASGRARPLQLAPEHRRQREADQVVERPACLIRIDQAIVQVARVAHRLEHGAPGDLVEHHPLDVDAVDRAAVLERGEQVPGDRLALAVRVGRQVEVVGVLERLRDLGDPLLPVGEQLVDDPEVLVRQHRAVLLRQVAHVTVAGQHAVARAQVLVDVPGLGRGFDDDDVHDRDAFPCLAWWSGAAESRRQQRPSYGSRGSGHKPDPVTGGGQGRRSVRSAGGWHGTPGAVRQPRGAADPGKLRARRRAGIAQPMASDTRLPGWRSRRPSSSSSSSARCTSAVLAWHCRISSSTRSGSGPRRSHTRPIRSAPSVPRARAAARLRRRLGRASERRVAGVAIADRWPRRPPVRSRNERPERGEDVGGRIRPASRRRAAAGWCRGGADRAGCPAPP